MHPDRKAGCRTIQHSRDFVVEPARRKFPFAVSVSLMGVAEAAVGTRGGLGGLVELLWLEFGPALVGPVFSLWPAFNGARHYSGCRRNSRVAEVGFYFSFPGVWQQDIREPGGVRSNPGLGQEGLQACGIRSASMS